jgi:hypothetical protein
MEMKELNKVMVNVPLDMRNDVLLHFLMIIAINPHLITM